MDKLQERIKSKVIRINGCWTWQGAKSSGGYGHCKYLGKLEPAHRVSYQAFKGKIPDGLHIDHLCRRRDCVNPDHLEAVTKYENTMRGFNPAAINARKTHCIKGHPFDRGNTYIDKQNKRTCRICQKAAQKRYKTKVKEFIK